MFLTNNFKCITVPWNMTAEMKIGVFSFVRFARAFANEIMCTSNSHENEQLFTSVHGKRL